MTMSLLPWLFYNLVVARALIKRDAVIGTLDIPFSLSDDFRYTVPATMGSVGTPQHFNFTFSTTIAYILVASNQCSSCGTGASYNAAGSASERNLTGTGGVTIGDTASQGPLIKENCTLQQLNGTSWNYPNQTVISVTSTNATSGGIFSGDASGLFGVGLAGANISFQDTIPGGFFHRNPHTNVFSFGMQLEPPYTSGLQQQNGTAGFLHWLAANTSAYQGNVTLLNVTTPPTDSTQTPLVGGPDWQILLTAWTIQIGSTALNNDAGGSATVEPYFPEIYLPLSEAESIYGLITGAVVLTNNSIYVEWMIPCNTSMTWSVNFAGTPFSVPSSTLVVPSGSSCVGTIRGWSDPNQTGYLLGSSFVSSVYLIFSINRDPSDPNTLGVAQKSPSSAGAPSTSKSTPVGAIVGGVIGGVALIAIIVLATWFMLQRRRQFANRPVVAAGRTPNEKAVDPLTLSPPSTAGLDRSFDSSNGTIKTPYSPTPGSPATATYNTSPTSPAPAISILSRTNRESGFENPGSDYRASSHGDLGRGEGEYLIEPLYLPTDQHGASAVPQSQKQQLQLQLQQQRTGTFPGNRAPEVVVPESSAPPGYSRLEMQGSGSTEFSPTDTLVDPHANGRKFNRAA